MATHRTCLDDRNQRVFVPSPLDARPSLAQTPRGQSVTRAREELFAAPYWSAYRWPVALAVVLVVWFFLRGFEVFLNFNDAPLGRFLVRGSVALFTGFAVFRTLPRTYPRLALASDDLSAARICPVCLTNLEKVALAPDNCTVCPRCACAVRLTPPQEP